VYTFYSIALWLSGHLDALVSAVRPNVGSNVAGFMRWFGNLHAYTMDRRFIYVYRITPLLAHKLTAALSLSGDPRDDARSSIQCSLKLVRDSLGRFSESDVAVSLIHATSRRREIM